MKIYKIREKCAVCDNTELKSIMEYGMVPLAGDFPSKTELLNDRKFNLNVEFCDKCSLLQTDSVIDADILFKDYRYMSSIGLSGHFKSVAEMIKEKFNPKKVLEIGSNDGVLLKPLQDLGIDCVGVEPAINISQVAKDKGCNVINDYFNEEAVEKYNLDSKFDLAVSNNCFAHIDDIKSIVKGVKKSLKPNGKFMVEVHYVKNLIEQLQYDNIYHEHLYYYSLNALNNLFSQFDMTIIGFEEIPIHAGSIRVIVENDKIDCPLNVSKRLKEEEKWGLTSIDWLEDFGDKVRNHISTIKNTLTELKSKGHKICGYGASGRANMICNLAEITPDIVEYIVDESPERAGRFIAGTHVPIVDKSHLDGDEEKPTYIIIFAWNFSKMIIEKLKGNGYKYIIAFPTMNIVESYEELENFTSI